MTDMEIAHGAKMKPITDIAEKLGIAGDDIIQYGKYKAKIPLRFLDSKKLRKAPGRARRRCQ